MLSTFFPILQGIIFEFCLFGNHRKKRRRGAARLIHPRFPFTDGLLSRTQPPGELALRKAQMAPQSLDALTVPFLSVFFAPFVHTGILHDLVYAVKIDTAGHCPREKRPCQKRIF